MNFSIQHLPSRDANRFLGGVFKATIAGLLFVFLSVDGPAVGVAEEK